MLWLTELSAILADRYFQQVQAFVICVIKLFNVLFRTVLIFLFFCKIYDKLNIKTTIYLFQIVENKPPF